MFLKKIIYFFYRHFLNARFRLDRKYAPLGFILYLVNYLLWCLSLIWKTQIWSFWRFWPKAWSASCWSGVEEVRSSPFILDCQVKVVRLMINRTVERNAAWTTRQWLSLKHAPPTPPSPTHRPHRPVFASTCHHFHVNDMMVMSVCRSAMCQTNWWETHTHTLHSGTVSVFRGLTQGLF